MVLATNPIGESGLRVLGDNFCAGNRRSLGIEHLANQGSGILLRQVCADG
jgi:hypothetical protein